MTKFKQYLTQCQPFFPHFVLLIIIIISVVITFHFLKPEPQNRETEIIIQLIYPKSTATDNENLTAEVKLSALETKESTSETEKPETTNSSAAAPNPK